MRRIVTITLLIVILVVVGTFFIRNASSPMNTLNVTSSAFLNDKNIPSSYTCDGDDMNPPLLIENIPTGTQSLAIVIEDPDSPSGMWVHWVKWNIKANVPITMINEGVEPEGVSGSGTAGQTLYQGPCPNKGTHHYIFGVYALDTLLDLLEGSTREALLEAMNGHVLARGELTGLYTRITNE